MSGRAGPLVLTVAYPTLWFGAEGQQDQSLACRDTKGPEGCPCEDIGERGTVGRGVRGKRDVTLAGKNSDALGLSISFVIDRNENSSL